MKVYVDEFQKSCEKCKFYECQTELAGEWGKEKHRHICKINGSLIQGICPLQSLSDYAKQVRKEVVQEIIGKLCRIEDTLINLGNGKEDALNYFVGILKEIEQGENNG